MTKHIFANWKMQLNLTDSTKLAESYLELVEKYNNTNIFACVPTWAIATLVENFGEKLQFAAQDCSVFAGPGAFTGESSAQHLADLGCKAVLVGHSERRTLLNESNEQVATKALNALQAGLTTCLLIGETAEQLAAGKTEETLRNQLAAVFEKLARIDFQPEKLLIGYEPVWAISTNQGAREASTDEIAVTINLVHEITKELSSLAIPVLYGGSVNKDNAEKYARISGISGFIPGGASLKIDQLAGILDFLA